MTDGERAPLEIEITRLRSDVSRVTLVGELDSGTAEHFARTVVELRTSGASQVVVDLSRVTFLDSSGINALVVSHDTAAAAGGSVIFAAPSEQTARLFDLLHLTDVVTVDESLEAAVDKAMATNDGPR
jgi:stage II sporulation protein AA (anti-sigma F factor antagonist)